ncbi:PREDICTED: uncharacterized protein LOC104768192 [Camelina sativa]|uniref:Uncharacterized protein LOC104768192 n=1 Tax=Camelina sativa TaxID=90675 RepID=A0ABM0XSL0_CAMSA|nr:PREDICTED: uncharacterized protein LOC104768192 [Camelina sativa]
MVGISPEVMCHRLNIDPTFKPVRQKRRRLGPDRVKAVQDEVERLLKADQIVEVQYPDWLANPVVVKKKNGKWRVCVDFTDLNKACPKDSFPLPHVDRLVEATAGNQLLSFMDAFSGYNQIAMSPADREKTAFITDRGTYCYKVMPFGLKNAGATYQRLVNMMFADLLGKTMEVYIDDMLVKSLIAEQHVQHLTECFDILDQFEMKLNPTKCTFGVTSGEFLGYIVTERGIEANPKQIEAILGLPSPTNKREVQRLTDRIAALNRFIARSTDKCLPFYQLLRGNKDFHWDEECEVAFRQLKEYLTCHSVLVKPEDGEALYLYISVSSSAVSGVLVRDDRGDQKPIFYTSKALNDAESRYPTLEKLALAVIIAARKLRPYFQSHSIVVLTDQPLRTVLHSPLQSGRMAKWAVELSEYDIEYRSRPSLKSQVLVDFITELSPELDDPTPAVEQWTMFVDGSSTSHGSGVGLILRSPTGEILEQALKLNFKASNNETKYEAVLAGLRLARGLGVKHLQVYCDSQLVVSQFSGEFDAKNKRMGAYQQLVRTLSGEFASFSLTKIPRNENASADALAALANRSDPELRRTIPIECIDAPSIDPDSQIAVINDDSVPMEVDEPIEDMTDVAKPPEDWQLEIKLYISDAEATNKSIVDELKKRLGRRKGAWADHLDGVLWSYRTTPRRSTGQSPFSLAYGLEALAPAEAGVRTLRCTMMVDNPELNDKILIDHNDLAEELRDKALVRVQHYQDATARYYNKTVCQRRFNEGDLVLREVFENTKEVNAGKLGARWEGPYLMSRAVRPGVYELVTMAGEQIKNSWNAAHLKRYYS